MLCPNQEALGIMAKGILRLNEEEIFNVVISIFECDSFIQLIER